MSYSANVVPFIMFLVSDIKAEANTTMCEQYDTCIGIQLNEMGSDIFNGNVLSTQDILVLGRVIALVI